MNRLVNSQWVAVYLPKSGLIAYQKQDLNYLMFL